MQNAQWQKYIKKPNVTNIINHSCGKVDDYRLTTTKGTETQFPQEEALW